MVSPRLYGPLVSVREIYSVQSVQVKRSHSRVLFTVRHTGQAPDRAAVGNDEHLDSFEDLVEPGVQQWPDLYTQVEFFPDLPREALFWSLARLQLATRQFPFSTFVF